MNVLNALYPRTSTLEDYLTLPPLECRNILLDEDKPGYKSFLRNTVVGIPSCCEMLQQPISYLQLSDQAEVVIRVIKKLHKQKSKNEKNVLLLGWQETPYRLWSAPSVSGASNTGHFLPGNTSFHLKTPNWKRLLSRIGDEAMMHVLADLSVFVKAPPSCFIQLTGTPVYDLVASGASSLLTTQPICPTQGVSAVRSGRGQKRKLELGTEGSGAPSKRICHEPSCSTSNPNQIQSKMCSNRTRQSQPTCRGQRQTKTQLKTCSAVIPGMSQCTGLGQSQPTRQRQTETQQKRSSAVTLGKSQSTRQGQCGMQTKTCPKRMGQSQPTGQRQSEAKQKRVSAVTMEMSQSTGHGQNGMQTKTCPKRMGQSQPTGQRQTETRQKRVSAVTMEMSQSTGQGQSGMKTNTCPKRTGQSQPTGQRQSETKQKRVSAVTMEMSQSTGQGQRGMKTNTCPKRMGQSQLTEHRHRQMGTQPKTCPLMLKNSQPPGGRDRGTCSLPSYNTKKVTRQVRTHSSKASDHTLQPSTSKMFYAVDMCYNLGGRQALPKSHPIEAVPTNASGARQLTGVIFNVTYINKSYQQPAQGMTEEENKSEKTAFTKSHKKRRKPKMTPRRYIEAQKLIRQMIRQHRKTNIYQALKINCPFGEKLDKLKSISHQHQKSKEATSIKKQQDSNQASMSELKVQEILSCKSKKGPVVCRRRPPPSASPIDDPVAANNSAITTATKNAAQSDEIDMVSMATPSHQIYLFVRSVLIRVVPSQLWGSLQNRAVFFKFVKQYLYLGRYEKLSLQQLINDICASDCAWTYLGSETNQEGIPCRSATTGLAKRHQMVTDFFIWLMDTYVVTLVKTMFYVTEASFSKSQLLFYHKPLWHKLSQNGARKLKDTGILESITEQVAMEMMRSQRSLGCSRLRFVPKKRGLRPIVRMGKSSIPTKETLSINILLQDMFDVLTYIKGNRPAFFGSAVLGTDTIYPKWGKFVQAQREDEDHSRKLYFIKLDIEKCYESIKHDKLFQVMTTLLNSQPGTKQFAVHRYATVTLGQGQLQRSFHRQVDAGQDVNFHGTLMGLAKKKSLKNAVIVNQVCQHEATVNGLLTRLQQHVEHDILKCGGQHYLRTSGICQGSVISSLLCSFFYAHMEKCCLSGIADDGLLLHLVDDFLLVTPHLDKAQRFLTVLLKGLPQYGCYANPSKTLVNFDFENEGTNIPRIPAGGLFPWCGLLFDTTELHVYNEYARYHGIMIRYTMTMDTTGDVFASLKSKLKKSLGAKDVCIFVDPIINSPQDIISNSYHMFLMLAFRFHGYISNLPSSCSTSCLQDSLLLGFILHLCFYYHGLVHNKLASHDALPEDVSEAFPLTKTTVKWLCLKAFFVKLSKHQTRYRALLKLISKHRRKTAVALGCTKVADLQACCTPDIPNDFMMMK